VRLLREAGIEAEVVPTPSGGSSVGRAAAWARLRGSGARRPLILLSHLDVVPAAAKEWTAEPFGGEQRGGQVIGRGALDAKGVAVVQLLALAQLARRGEPLTRDIIFLATPDEETGGRRGSGYLVHERRDLLGNAEYLLTEGGGVRLGAPGRPAAWQVAITEKSPCWLRLVARGRPGHSSVPPRTTAVGTLVGALARVRRHQPPIRVIPEVARMFSALAPLAPRQDARRYKRLQASLRSDAAFRRRFLTEPAHAALVRDTFAITVLRGSQRTNVLPAEAVAHLDARLLPGRRCESFAGEISTLVDEPNLEIEALLSHPSRSSPIDTALYRAIGAVAAVEDPNSVVVPRVLAGFTDAHFFRELGITAHGFVPRWLRPGEQQGVHGPDERISVENLERGVRTLVAVIEELDRHDRSGALD